MVRRRWTSCLTISEGFKEMPLESCHCMCLTNSWFIKTALTWPINIYQLPWSKDTCDQWSVIGPSAIYQPYYQKVPQLCLWLNDTDTAFWVSVCVCVCRSLMSPPAFARSVSVTCQKRSTGIWGRLTIWNFKPHISSILCKSPLRHRKTNESLRVISKEPSALTNQRPMLTKENI